MNSTIGWLVGWCNNPHRLLEEHEKVYGSQARDK